MKISKEFQSHVTIKDVSRDILQKRIDEMEIRGHKLDGDIVEYRGWNGALYYAKLVWTK